MTAALRTFRTVRSSAPRLQTASFSVAARRMAGGDAGAPRSGGASQGDAFTKREEASENLYIKQQEQEKLKQLKAKIASSKEQLAKDEKDLKDLEGK
ncbi:mitochondrial ATPase inhibitor, IATP-domain-containing protein [Elsinoe ampelina]|uniref:ATPase inhibitor, mitochondrial n=1 Tax=Elsinoe ampelina TaxID=302913 RepID=A0A6A6GR37_9PEZI|nr:mitochondrial ATPase inhibitor, IATP-domain-containing protein [Elsinoe ampelina]